MDLTQLLYGTNDLYNELLKENLEKRILTFNDQVDENVVENYILHILKWNAEDRDLPIEKRQPITIYLSCPGGNTFDGFNMVDVIMNSKTPVRGVVFSLAASMGYHILLACHERISFKNSVLLQHDGQVGIQNSTSKARDTMRFFDSMEARTKDYVLAHTAMTEEFYDKIYDQEYYMYADEAKKLGCIDKIIGEDCDIDEIL